MKCNKRNVFLQKFSKGVTENASEIKDATKKQEERTKQNLDLRKNNKKCGEKKNIKKTR